MPKTHTRFVCQECGRASASYMGKCPQCGEDIDFDRLDALPHARLCIKDKQREEDGKKQS